MSNPSALKKVTLAVSAIAVVAVVAIVSGSSHLRTQRVYAAKSLATPTVNGEQRGRVLARMDALPLAFEANQGQTDPRVKYMARGSGYTAFLTARDTRFVLTSSTRQASPAPREIGRTQPENSSPEKEVTAAIDMRLVGGNPEPEIAGNNQLPGTVNYFIGNDRSKWQQGVKQYGAVSYNEVYPGVNMLFHGQQRQLEFDFTVSPGFNPAVIGMGFKGARRVSTDAAGNLVLSSAAGDVVLHKPAAYQEKNGQREPVDVAFQFRSENEVAFKLGDYDHERELVIDPTLTYSTYLGGVAEDDAYAIAIDGSGSAYVTGQTKSTNFPTVTGSYSTGPHGGFDVFVTKLSANGSSLVYSTYVGGSSDDSGTAIAVDGSGDAFVAGGTASSSNFPTTSGAFQTTYGGGSGDAFVFELSPSGNSLVYSTFLGGSGADAAFGIAIDASGTYVVGTTQSTDFPTQGPYQGSNKGGGNGFVTKLNTSGNALVYSTYLGAGFGDFASAVAVDTAGNAYVTGATLTPTFPTTSGVFQKTCGSDGTCNGGLYDAFVTVFNPSGAGLVYSTFLGGKQTDQGLGIAVTGSGTAYVTGLTKSSDFPLKSALQSTFTGQQNAFVTEINPTGTAMVYSTYLGGSGYDAGTSIALDGSNNAYVTGQTSSSDFPTSSGAVQTTIGGGNDAFVSKISDTGSTLIFSTYLGGSLNENSAAVSPLSPLGAVAVDSTGANVYVAGNTASTNFPTHSFFQSSNGGGIDAFVASYAIPDFSITGTALAPVTQGGSTTSTITVASVDSYAGTVNLACSVANVSGGSPAPTCSISPTAVTSGAGTSTLSVKTTGSASAMSLTSPRLLYAMWLPVVGMALIGMRLSTAGSRQKKLLGFLLLGIVMTTLFFLPACGGNSNSGGGGCSGCTPKGNYTVTVTGTDSGNSNLTHSVSPALTLTVN